MATINGTAGNDILTGTSSNDLIFGLAGNDKITGGLGLDTVRPGAGNDTIDGGPGDTGNVLVYDDLRVGVTITVSNGSGTARGTRKSDTFKNFVAFAGSQGNDVFTTGALTRDGFYSFQGNRGNDRVIGNSAFDELRFEQNDITRGIYANLVTGVIIDAMAIRIRCLALNVSGPRVSPTPSSAPMQRKSVFKPIPAPTSYMMVEASMSLTTGVIST